MPHSSSTNSSSKPKEGLSAANKVVAGGNGGGGGGSERSEKPVGSAKPSARETAYSIPTNDEEVNDGFVANLVVPDVIDKSPCETLGVTFGDDNSIGMGNLLTPEDLRYKPCISFDNCDPKRFYTLIMTDPDVPNRAMPTDREHLHWLVLNITENNLSKGEEIVPYKPPLPNLGTGLHRYVFLLIEQTRPITIMPEPKATSKTSSASTTSKTSTTTTGKTSTAAPPKTADKRGGKEESTKSGGNGTPVTVGKTSAAAAGAKAPTVSTRGSTSSFEKMPSSDDEDLLIERKQFSTKDFLRKYAVLGVVAGNFFQTEYNEYVGRQLEAAKCSIIAAKKKNTVQEVKKLDEKKTLDSMKNLKIGSKA